MVTLYVCSPATGAGKTGLSVGLARRLTREGLAVAYQKPVGTSAAGPASSPQADPDAAFAQQVLRLRLAPETVSPVDLARAPGDAAEARQRLQTAFEAASRGQDVLVAEGAPDLRAGSELGLSGPEVAFFLDARVIVVAAYAPEGLADSILAAVAAHDGRAIGAVVTAIPEAGWPHMAKTLRPALEKAGVALLGELPLSRELLGMTVGELTTALGGELISGDDGADRPVEAYMVASISDQNTADYFRRHSRKAVLAGGDRPDVQVAALETDTACLVLTRGTDPQPAVLALARELDVPILKVSVDTVAALEAISDALATVRFRQPHKVPAMTALLDQHFDYPALRRGLGLRQEATP